MKPRFGVIDGGRVETGIGPAQQLGEHRLTDKQIGLAKIANRSYKLADGASLYIAVNPTGAKLWRLDFRLPGKKNKQPYSIGAWPEFDCTKARVEAETARVWIRKGLNPTIQRKGARIKVAEQQAVTFGVVAEEWLASKQKWSSRHRASQKRLIERFITPALGELPIADIETPHLLETLRAIERKGAHELLAKTRQILGQVCRRAVATGRRTTDPSTALAGVFGRPPIENRATVSEAELPQLFEALAKVPTEGPSIKLALFFVFATAARPGEVRFCTWSEVDLKAKLWRVPGARMKMRQPHLVPLSPLALSILERAKQLRQTGEPDEFVFPGFSQRNRDRRSAPGSLSENSFISLLARCGYLGRMHAHGARAAFSTWANEQEFDPAAIELALAHRPQGVKGVYDRALRLKARATILQKWGEFLIACGLRLP